MTRVNYYNGLLQVTITDKISSYQDKLSVMQAVMPYKHIKECAVTVVDVNKNYKGNRSNLCDIVEHILQVLGIRVNRIHAI